MTPSELAAIEARLRAATETDCTCGHSQVEHYNGKCDGLGPCNCSFYIGGSFANAPADIAALLDEVKRLRAELDDATRCPECQGSGRMIFNEHVASNGDWVDKDTEGECICCDGSGRDR